MECIVIKISHDKKDLFFQELGESKIFVEIIESKQFDGSCENLCSFLIAINSISIPIIGKYLIEQIKSKKHHEVIYKGTKIKGLSEEKMIEALNKLLENKKNDTK